MLDFLLFWGWRRILKQAAKAEATVAIEFMGYDGMLLPCRPIAVKGGLVVLDMLEGDEQGWLSTHVMPIASILSINLDSTDRARLRLVNQFERDESPNEPEDEDEDEDEDEEA